MWLPSNSWHIPGRKFWNPLYYVHLWTSFVLKWYLIKSRIPVHVFIQKIISKMSCINIKSYTHIQIMHNDKLYIPHNIYNLNVCLLIASTEVWRVNAELSSFRLGQFLIFGFSDLPGNVLYCIFHFLKRFLKKFV